MDRGIICLFGYWRVVGHSLLSVCVLCSNDGTMSGVLRWPEMMESWSTTGMAAAQKGVLAVSGPELRINCQAAPL